MKKVYNILIAICLVVLSTNLKAQDYPKGLIDKTVAIIGDEMISLSQLEQEIQYMRANGMASDKNLRCAILEKDLEAKLYLMQAKIDSLTVNGDYVNSMLKQRINEVRQALGGDEGVENYFGKSLHKLRSEWKQTMEDQSLIQQMQESITSKLPDLTPADVKSYIASLDSADVPMVPVKYKLSQICIYPDRDAAKLAIKDKLLKLRERIINGEKFSTLARIYSEDPGSASKGGELGLTPKSSFWPAFSDAAMSLKPGMISQVIETPDGFHIIQVIEKKGDMFNARHILMKPKYTSVDREKAFKKLDSLRTEILNKAVTFDLAAKFYSQDAASRTNGGRMSDPQTGSSYFEIDQIYPPADYNAIKNLKEGEITMPFESLDREGRNGNTVYKIIKVDKIIPAHKATFNQDYTQLLEAAKQKKMIEALNNFIVDKIKTTHIIIDPMFKDCHFSRPAWNNLVKGNNK